MEGMVQGDIRASGKVELRQTAQLAGDIFSERISIEDLATMTGKVAMVRTFSPEHSSEHREPGKGKMQQGERQ